MALHLTSLLSLTPGSQQLMFAIPISCIVCGSTKGWSTSRLAMAAGNPVFAVNTDWQFINLTHIFPRIFLGAWYKPNLRHLNKCSWFNDKLLSMDLIGRARRGKGSVLNLCWQLLLSTASGHSLILKFLLHFLSILGAINRELVYLVLAILEAPPEIALVL